MALAGLGGLALEIILIKVGAKSASVFACVSRSCRHLASDDNLWRKFCSHDIELLVPEDLDGNPYPSFKVAYQAWQESFGMYPWTLVRRAKKCWSEIKNWMAENFPEARNTLQKGASESEIKDFEEKVGVKLPLPTKVLYRFCNGQNTLTNDLFEKREFSFMGIMGGYSFYNHVVNVHLLPLSMIMEETRELESVLGSPLCSEYIVVATSCYADKFFLLSCTSGQLYVGTRNLASDREMLPCVPTNLVKLEQNVANDVKQDALLLWLEEHIRRLRHGFIQLRKFKKARSICLFPELPPFCTTAVTHGVQVRASSVFVPELCDLKDNQGKFWFSYSIRMRLLPEGCLLDGTHFSSCQLSSRNWIIRANDNVTSEVNGEAVVGKYPFLCSDQGEFVYESCSPLPFSSGSVEGSFTFVPGRLTKPEGRRFEAEVARFSLEVPSYIF